MDLRELRDTLAPLGDKLHDYSEAIYDAGFTCCHIDIEWFEKDFKTQDIEFHKRYLVEFAREALVSDSTSTIIYTDELNCRSKWLNELKANRLKTHGSVDNIRKSWKTTHLTQLSPCLQELSRITDSPEPIDRQKSASLMESFIRRRAYELVFHDEQIKGCLVKLDLQDEASLQGFYAEQLMEAFRPFGAEVFNTAQMYEQAQVIAFNLGDDLMFVLYPIVTCSELPKGSLGMGYRLANICTLKADKYEKGKYVVLNMSTLLPSEFINYGHFSTREELCLNILANIASARVILPDILEILRTAVKENS